MIVLIFGGQAMFFEKDFNIITTDDYYPSADGENFD
jgi:hypothetical protein